MFLWVRRSYFYWLEYLIKWRVQLLAAGPWRANSWSVFEPATLNSINSAWWVVCGFLNHWIWINTYFKLYVASVEMVQYSFAVHANVGLVSDMHRTFWWLNLEKKNKLLNYCERRYFILFSFYIWISHDEVPFSDILSRKSIYNRT